MLARIYKKLKAQAQRLNSDRSGMSLLYVTISLPAIIGMGLLAIDVGRVSSLQSSLQHGADALALAGAGELDGGSDSITRANLAMTQLVLTNKALFVTSAVNVNFTDVNACYLPSIPASDTTAITTACLTTSVADQALAKFVRVRVNPKQWNTVFPASFIGGQNSGNASAEAVAGYGAAMCNYTPLYICNPNEPLSGATNAFADFGFAATFNSETERRKMVALNGPQQYAPGNFGYLCPVDSNNCGASDVEASIAAEKLPACTKYSQLTTKTGNANGVNDGFNVRFDLYAANMNSKKGTYAPSVNVRKGYTPQGANNWNPPNNPDAPNFALAMGLPRDRCFYTGTANPAPVVNCPAGSNGRIGDGLWGGDNPGATAANMQIATDRPAVSDFIQYWRYNHPASRPVPSPADITTHTGINVGNSATPYTNANPPSRYAIYRYEIARGWIGDTGTATGLETGTPRSTTKTPLDNPDRRIIYAAVLNCRAISLGGGKSTGRPIGFAKMFIVEPVPTANGSLYTERVSFEPLGSASSNSRDIVQLYR